MTRLNFLANAKFPGIQRPSLSNDGMGQPLGWSLWGCEIEGPCHTATQPQVSMGDLVYKNRWPIFPLSSVWYSLTHSTLLIFALIVIFYSTCFTHNSQLFLFSLLVPSHPSLVSHSLQARVLVARAPLHLGR